MLLEYALIFLSRQIAISDLILQLLSTSHKKFRPIKTNSSF